MSILIGDDGLPKFTVNPGQDYDGTQRFAAPENAAGPSVHFYPKSVQMGQASLEAGRPIFQSTLFIRIQQPGERDCLDTRASAEHIQKYMAQYQRFLERRGSDKIEGTPLDSLFPAHPDTVETLRYFKVYTVEQLAALSDTAQGTIGHGAFEWKMKARNYLEVTEKGKGFAAAEAAKETLERAVRKAEADKALQDQQIAALTQQIGQLTQQIQVMMGAGAGQPMPVFQQAGMVQAYAQPARAGLDPDADVRKFPQTRAQAGEPTFDDDDNPLAMLGGK